MALDKAIKAGKEKRKPYWGAKAVDRTCRNNGSCPWCKDNRTHNTKRALFTTHEDLEEMPYDDN